MLSRLQVVLLPMVGVLFLVGSCKDMGSEVPILPDPLTIGLDSLGLIPGEIRSTILSGGTRPYSFVSTGDTSIAVPSITGDSLKVRAKIVGRTTIVVGDNGSPKLKDTITVNVKQLSVSQTSFSLLTGDSVSVIISGGVQPYGLVSQSDTGRVAVSISGLTMTIRAMGAGNSVIVVGDNSSPRLTDTVRVSVTAAILFSSQVQPIFSANCAVPGCHVAGGSGPMSLVAGSSFGNLVGVNATRGSGSCPGSLRVEPLNADASVLVKRITGSCGLAQMPLGGTPLSATQIQLIKDWINQGARNN